MIRIFSVLVTLLLLHTLEVKSQEQDRLRARELGVVTGILTPGINNAITDVVGVEVGQLTKVVGDSVRTGVTAIKPHGGNIYQEKVPAAIYVGNGFGKLMGITQVEELGNIETPIVLTNTLSVPVVADALTDYVLGFPGNEQVRSVNAVVGETNDGWLNDIRGKHVTKSDVLQALNDTQKGKVAEGNVGAGTGTSCLGYKGGIGTSSRKLPASKGGYTVGVLVQSNFGGILTINGAPVGVALENHYMATDVPYDVDGSCMIVVATDTPLSSRNLKRLAKRAFMALARVGGFASNGSGDYVIAFSNDPGIRVAHNSNDTVETKSLLRNDEMSPLFLATVEATEEAILNSLFMANDMVGNDGHQQYALPIQETLKILTKHQLLSKE